MKITYAKLIPSLFLSIFLLNSCKLTRFVVYNFADINDHKKFPSRIIENDDKTFHFATALQEQQPADIEIDGKKVTFDRYLQAQNTVAFLIIRNDTIQYERYFGGYDQSAIVPSFSMAKSITSILIGCALDDRLIQSIDEPVTNYIPELHANGFDQVKIRHLLQMTSGIKFNEGYYNPFGEVATFYYGTNLRKAIRKLKLEAEPGTRFKYSSGDSQVLGLVLARALKNKTISQYLQEKIWQPVGMEYAASWSLDRKKDGLEKTFCCINAPARDFAKIGRLYLNQGNWNGQQLVPKKWVAESTQIDSLEGSKWYYQHQWWLTSKKGDYMAVGILGQYIYVNPAQNLIIVRLGKNGGKADWPKVFIDLAGSFSHATVHNNMQNSSHL